jgi:hypothetical protein
MPTHTQREREAAQRKAKLDRIKEQIDDGSLVIRKMTDEERRRYSAGREDRAESADPRERKRAAAARSKRARNRARQKST